MSDYLGLSWSGQYERLNRDKVLNSAVAFVRVVRSLAHETADQGVRVTRTPTQKADGQQAVLCLRLRLLPGWLFGINAKWVKVERREKIIHYRRECFQMLWNAFKHDIVFSEERTTATNTCITNAQKV
jgi:P22_AR N-terminal domain